MATAWKELCSSFADKSENELRAALCRISHYERSEVPDIRSGELDVQQWLSEHKVPAQKLYAQISEKKPSEYAKRYSTQRQDSKWRFFLELKARLSQVVPEAKPEEIRKMVRRVSRWEYGEVKKLSEQELEIRDIILSSAIRPATVFKWLLTGIVPDDLRDKIEQGTITLVQAGRLHLNRQHQVRAAAEIRLMESARAVVREVL